VTAAAEPADDTVDTSKLGYFFGYHFGNLLKQQGSVDIDMEELRRGIQDSVTGKASALGPQEQQSLMAVIRTRQAAVKVDKEQAIMQAARAYLAENAKKEGVITTLSGLQYEVLSSGSGESPNATDEVQVHYRGQLVDGKEFDSSYKRNAPVEFRLNQVIPGWTEGLQLMNKGARYKFYIPPDLGYGAGGVPQAGIPPNAVLVFDVQLLQIM
tara:strand:- start:2711 stop:3346 length:636 start_codon:yes stop_codon:yes gene_type:complete